MKPLGILAVSLCVGISFSKAEVKKTASGDTAAGKVLFEAKCAVCHSAGSKAQWVGPGLKGIKDGKLPSGRNATHDVILDQLNMGGRGLLMTVNGYGMPIFRDLLSTKQKEDIIAYVLTL
jgi:mono/diheme cytochrome c family protein